MSKNMHRHILPIFNIKSLTEIQNLFSDPLQSRLRIFKGVQRDHHYITLSWKLRKHSCYNGAKNSCKILVQKRNRPGKTPQRQTPLDLCAVWREGNFAAMASKADNINMFHNYKSATHFAMSFMSVSLNMFGRHCSASCIV